jgi:hypothetical protein
MTATNLIEIDRRKLVAGVTIGDKIVIGCSDKTIFIYDSHTF